jgi:hypothetical protein
VYAQAWQDRAAFIRVGLITILAVSVQNATKAHKFAKCTMDKLAMMATSVFQTLALRFFNSQQCKVFSMDESAPTHR